MSKASIYIGPAGWSYPDWQGIVYPKKKSRDFSELGFISRYFSTVEINSSFYRIPSLSTAKAWLRQVERHDGFKFCIKLWNRFTHTEFPLQPEEVDQFGQILQILANEDKLGAVLIQFPWRFKKSTKTMQRLFDITDRFAAFPCAVEFRHGSWQEEDVGQVLHERKIAFVNIDQPVIGDSLSPTEKVTADVGYVRLHGRNRAAWFADDAGRDERYNYLYSDAELGEWVTPIERMREQTETTFIIFNNHFRGKALINAFQMMYLINEEKPIAPETLLRHFPAANRFAKADLSGQTLQLF